MIQQPSETAAFLRRMVAALAVGELYCTDEADRDQLRRAREEAKQRAEWIEQALRTEA